MTIEEYINEINTSEYYCIWDIENDFKLDYYKRWIEPNLYSDHIIDTFIYKIGNRYFGIRGLVYKNDYCADWDDFNIKCTAFEVEEVPTTTFRIKQ